VGCFIGEGTLVGSGSDGSVVAVDSIFSTVGGGEFSAFAVDSSGTIDSSDSSDEQPTAATMRRKTVNPRNTCIFHDFSLVLINGAHLILLVAVATGRDKFVPVISYIFSLKNEFL
jgi:hypothetical protein